MIFLAVPVLAILFIIAIRKHVALYLLGWLLLLGGVGSAGYGIYEKNELTDSYYGLGAYRKSEINDAETFIIVGIVLVFIGLFVLIARYMAGRKSSAASANTPNGFVYVPVGTFMGNGARCSCCGAALPAGSSFCSKCGTSLVSTESTVVKKCASCGASLLDGSQFCSQCGTKAVNEDPQKIIQCSDCGAELQAGMMFCSKCGTKVEN